MLRKLLRLLPALVLACLALTVLPAPHQAAAEQQRLVPPDSVVLRQIRSYRRETWRWQQLMGVRRTPASRAAVVGQSRPFRIQVRDLWHSRAVHARKRAKRPPHRAAWLCIHRHEGPWNDPNPPYYGGLQMDVAFQRTYGRALLRRKGTADHWTPLEQMWVAELAYRSGRGFYPWPNTARYCGLI